jgi:hypothetical protein
MQVEPAWRRTVAVSTLLASATATMTLVLGVGVAEASINILGDTRPLLDIDPRGAMALRWSNVCCIFGYGLLLVPAALFLHDDLSRRSPRLARLVLAAALACTMFAALSVAVLVVVWPPLQESFRAAPATEQAALEATFRAWSDAMNAGVGSLVALCGAAWWLPSGALLREDHPWFGSVTMVLGGAALIGGLGLLLGSATIATVGLGVIFGGVPVWALWLGLAILRGWRVPAFARID